ncbi:UDP-N-acetylmuramoyl-L-alanyl-D-glutamate--2,6-diaminopimelate ligase [uncultured Oscillibacter sp.]|uniref:UDP-N-acetylmuramoyl-L-alanyl-D-glutamate--2, 6-diaminopimelate ligase n=1 Tax=uncultured Oscillibacter sp. TaxID=876091 RepID=UPI0025CD3E0E|nr:UDP-N-acetylmuramoyl-L-alanyl-D-glutamate--2,6-diaminopimelate ligase [uncultured Oscillibacter sp.]
MKLRELLRGLEVLSATADWEMEVPGVSYDSRTTRPGELFVAMTGFASDGHAFIGRAAAAGAAAVLCERPPEEAVPYVQVADSRRALAVVGANFFGHPAEAMTMAAVTGTNGKTTTTYLLKAILEQEAGAKVGLIGTNQNMIGGESLPTERTTPESFEVQRLFAQMRDAGCTHVVMETSSHALALDRVYGVHYAVGIFTNLTQDHLDFHGTMEAYCDAKAILFQNCDRGVVNADDPWTPRLLEQAACPVLTYGERAAADLRAEDIRLAADHVAFTAVTKDERVPVRVHIPGGFMVYNTLDVLGAALALGIPLEKSAQALARVPHVKGRVEVVPTPGKDYTVLVDYAHSPDGLENVLGTVKGFAKGRTIALFGCGGDRDKTKRPKMGAIAARIADLVVVTSDNPRTEVPGDIIADILPGLAGTKTPYVVVEDRVEAIHYCLDHARPGDVIALCGKGHETYQEVGRVKRHMDEREIVADYLAQGR